MLTTLLGFIIIYKATKNIFTCLLDREDYNILILICHVESILRHFSLDEPERR